LRPGLSVRFDWYGGPSLDMLTLHLDSGQTPRDYGNRQTSLERLRGAAAELQRRDQRGVLVLGDFNTMGCERCEPKVTAEQEQAAMAALEQQATPALSQLPLDRACTEYYRGKGSVLDHVLWMPPPARVNEPLRARASVQGLCAELACGHVTHAHHPAALDHLSDHCPVLVDWPQLQPHGAPTARGKLRP
jgi:endonuclease/exonuclease/phosphatase family metal-dependent hydrolase